MKPDAVWMKRLIGTTSARFTFYQVVPFEKLFCCTLALPVFDMSVRSQQKFLLQYFQSFRPLPCMIAETDLQYPCIVEPAITG